MKEGSTADAAAPASYDVFLSHNGADKNAVLEIARRLRFAGVEPFLDAWHLVPGEPWQEALEKAIDESRACAVFLGPEGFGPWENEEMRAALSRRVADAEYRVIPVLLPGALFPERGRLPRFLSRLTWVDFRPGLDDSHAFDRLVSGIRGIAPETDAGLTDSSTQDEIVCPFRGLEVFDEANAEFFFGREALTQHLIEQLRADRFLAVLGPSGSGKSSVVRAGLVPELRRGALPGSAGWRIEILRPGASPMEALATRLVNVTSISGDALGSRASILKALEHDERGLHSILQLAVDGRSSDDRIVIVVDQFEEVFTHVRDDAERARFVAALLYASSVVAGPTVVIMTMRADFFGKCAAIPGLADRLSERDVLVPPMDEADLRRAIVQPAELVGLQLEKGLVDTILADLGGEPGSLPLLQHTLFELFEGRRGRWLSIDRYRAIGGVKGAIAQRAETVYGRLSAAEQAAARRILLRLTQPGEGTEDTRRRASVTELVPVGEGGVGMEAVVNELAAARLITTSLDESGQEIVDVAHEALIRGWPRLQGWVEENPTALRVHRELTLAAEIWARSKRERSYLFDGPRLDETLAFAARNPDELNELERSFLAASRRARQTRTLGLIGALVVATVVFAAIGFVALGQREEAIKSAREAKTHALLSNGLALEREHPALALRLAVEALVRAETIPINTELFREDVGDMLATGRYAFLPGLIDAAWTDPAGRILVAGPSDGPAAVFDTTDGTVLAQLAGPPKSVQFPGGPSAGVFVVEYADGELEIRKVADGSNVEVAARISDVAVDTGPNGSTVVVTYGSSGDTASLPRGWLSSRGQVASSSQPSGIALVGQDVRTTSAPALVAAADPDTVPAQIRSAVDGSLVRDLAGPADVQLLAAENERVAVVAYRDGGVEVVRVADGGRLGQIPVTADGVHPAPVGDSFVLNLGDACALWTVSPLRGTDVTERCRRIVFSPDGRVVALELQGETRIYRVADRHLIARIPGAQSTIKFSPEQSPGTVVLQGSDQVMLYAAGDGSLVTTFADELLSGESGPGVEFSPDGSLVFLQMKASTVLVSTQTGKAVMTGRPSPAAVGDVEVPPEGIQAITFSRDGEWFIADFGSGLTEVRRVSAADASTGYVVGGGFWPGSDGALVIGGNGMVRIGPGGELQDVLAVPGGTMSIIGYLPGDAPSAAIVTFTSISQSVPPTSILTRHGELLPLEPGSPVEAGFSSDAAGTYVILNYAGGRAVLWDRSATPQRLTTFAGLSLLTWDPKGRWVQASLPTGETYLIDLGWLREMDGPSGMYPPRELERMACEGPAPRLIDDAFLTGHVGEAPQSCHRP